MHDMTQGSISRHLIRMAVPIAIGMLFQTLYYLIDLYFVARIGDDARLTNARGLGEADGDGYYIRGGIVVVPKGAIIAPGTVV